MKKLLFLLPIALLLSCSVQKRKYQKGYYVDWKNKHSKEEKGLARVARPASVAKAAFKEDAEATNEKAEKKGFILPMEKLVASELKKAPRLGRAPGDTCDVLVFKDGSEIKGKVVEIGTNEIKYKRCDSPDGPMYISRKSEIFMIKYANGSREVIKSNEPERQVQTTVQKPNSYNQRNFPKQIHPQAIASLVLGILSIVFAYVALLSLSFATGGYAFLFVLPFLFGLTAVVTGKSSLNRIREQPDIYRGKGMALPGLIMGAIIAGIYLIALTIVFLILAGL